MNAVLIVSLLVMAAVYAVMIGFHRWLGWTRAVEERLAGSLAPVPAEMSGAGSFSDRFNRSVGKLSFAERIERQLAAADSNMTVGEFILTRIALALGLFLLGWLISRQVVGGLPLAGIGYMLPAFNLSRLRSRRLNQFSKQLPDLLSMLTGSLRAGYGLLHALTVVEAEMPEPIAGEFRRVIRETALGYSISDALDHLVERIDNEDLALIVTAIHIQSEVGGSLADVLETIAHTIRERIQLKGEVKAMTGQQRITGWILSGMPIAVGTALMLLNPSYMMGVFVPSWPILIPIGAGVMIIFGNIVMRMVTKIEI